MQNISDILKETRLKKGLALSDVERETKIKHAFLEALEQGDFKKLPSESYALGFVKTYAEKLGISQTTAAALFRREYESKKIDIVPFYKKRQVGFRNKYMHLSSRGYVIIFLVIIVIFYLVFQFSFLFIGPKLEITSPKNNQIVKTNVVEVTGKTNPSATVLINGEEVYVDLTGSFRKNLYVYSGEREVEIIAKNRYGKETLKRVRVQVE